MIRRVKGEVLSQSMPSIVVEVFGVGLEVLVCDGSLYKEGDEVVLFTHLAVKQDGMDLYGFPSPLDLSFFERLISVSGIGPKTALSILRRAPREHIQNAIAARDIAYLTRVVGLSKKSAEKISVELSDKMEMKEHQVGEDGEVLDTLIALGYTEREARKALLAVPHTITNKEERLRTALKQS